VNRLRARRNRGAPTTAIDLAAATAEITEGHPMSQARFQKRLREKARQEKQAAKRARRAERAEAAEVEPDDDTAAEPEDVVIAKLAKLHEAFDAEQIDFDAFEEQKQELMSQLRVD
jgi:hypothetical protein